MIAAIIGGPRISTNGISVKNVKKKVDRANGTVTGAPLRKYDRKGGTVAAIMPAPRSMPNTEPTSKLRHLEFLRITTGTRKMMYDAATTAMKAILVQKSRAV